MSISVIAAVAENLCIGKNNRLPWNIPEDLKHFKEMTLGKVVVMGQNTFESILGYIGKPLPNRTNVVLTFDESYHAPEGVKIFNSIDKVLAAFFNDDIFFAGGASIYKQTIDLADTLYITHVHQVVDGDVFFPEIDKNKWRETEREDHDGFSFVTYNKPTA